jgi:cysteinyl-tRNA synthetase
VTELHQANDNELAAGLALLGFSGSQEAIIDPTLRTDIERSIDIDEQIKLRNEARKAKNFKESDRIRDELLAKGIVLKDGPTGTTWEVKR